MNQTWKRKEGQRCAGRHQQRLQFNPRDRGRETEEQHQRPWSRTGSEEDTSGAKPRLSWKTTSSRTRFRIESAAWIRRSSRTATKTGTNVLNWTTTRTSTVAGNKVLYSSLDGLQKTLARNWELGNLRSQMNNLNIRGRSLNTKDFNYWTLLQNQNDNRK